MVTENILAKFCFINDENNFQLKEVMKNSFRLKSIHIDIYPENPLVPSSKPFMLLSRIIEKNVLVANDENRLILCKDDIYDSCFMNVLFSEIKECYRKKQDYGFEFILNIQNIWYRITIFN